MLNSEKRNYYYILAIVLCVALIINTMLNSEKINYYYILTIVLCAVILSGAAHGLLGSRHFVVKITDFTDFHLILRGFQRYLKIKALFYTQTPTGTAPNSYLMQSQKCLCYCRI